MDNKTDIDKLVDDIITLCASDIIKHSMQYFINWFTIEQRKTIANAVAIKSYNKAIVEMNKYFKDKND